MPDTQTPRPEKDPVQKSAEQKEVAVAVGASQAKHAPKIDTRAEVPVDERFAGHLVAELLVLMQNREQAHDAIRNVHRFWTDSLTSEERDMLIDPNQPNNIKAIAERLQRQVESVLNEIPALIGIHQNQKGF